MRREQHHFAPYWEKAFVEGVKNERIAQGITQSDLAERMSDLGYRFDQATVYKIENGKRKVTATEAWGLAEILDVELDYLYDYKSAHNHPEARRKLLHTQADNIFQLLLQLQETAARIDSAHRALAYTMHTESENGLTEQTHPGAPELPVAEYYQPLTNLFIHNELLWRLRKEVWTGDFAELGGHVSGVIQLGDLSDG